MMSQQCRLLAGVQSVSRTALTRPMQAPSWAMSPCACTTLLSFQGQSIRFKPSPPSAFTGMQRICEIDECKWFCLPPGGKLRSDPYHRHHSRLQATGRIGGQVWTEKSDTSRTESGANASTSQSKEDPLGDKEEQFWQGKSDEETQRFLEAQKAQVQVHEKLNSQRAAVFASWRFLGAMSIAAAVGVTAYAIWEKEQYKVALQERSTATVGAVVPMLPPPRDWTAWQVLPLCLSLLISLFCQRPQTVQLASLPHGPLPAGAESSGLALRVHRLEEEFDSGIKTVRFLARQLEKLGVRFRLSRRTLRDPIREHTETIEAIKAELQITNARLLRLEEGLYEAQELMLAMQEQQAKQFAVLAAALPKVASAHRRFSKPPDANKPKSSPGGPGGQSGSPVQKATSNAAKTVQAKAGQVLGSIRVPHVGKYDGPGQATGRGTKTEGRPGGKRAGVDREKKGLASGASVPARDGSNSSLPGPSRTAPKPGASNRAGLSGESTSGGSLSEKHALPDVAHEATTQQGNVQKGVPMKEQAESSRRQSDGPLVYSPGSNGPLGMLSARDAESLIKDVEVPEHYLEERAMWEAYKNSLVDRRVDIPGGNQMGS